MDMGQRKHSLDPTLVYSHTRVKRDVLPAPLGPTTRKAGATADALDL